MKFFWFFVWFSIACFLIGLIKIKLLFVSEGNFFCSVYFKILFFKFRIFSNFDNNKPAPKKPKVKTSVKKPSKKKQPFFQKSSFLCLLIEPTINLLKFLNRGFKICKIKLSFKLAGEDACETAVFYGNFCSFFYGFLGLLSSICKVEIDTIKIVPNFRSEKSEYSSCFCMQIGFGRLFIGLNKYILTIIMKIYLNKMKQTSKI